MNFRSYIVRCKLIPIGGLMLASMQVLALTNDSQQPIYINSSQQVVNIATNTAIFSDEVVVKRGSIDVRADKVVITRPDIGKNNEIIECYGNPVTFYQLQENDKPVRGSAQKVRYEIANDLIILTGDAYLEQLDSNVKGDRITYLVKKQQMEAFSDKGKRVVTVLLPAQLQNIFTSKTPIN